MNDFYKDSIKAALKNIGCHAAHLKCKSKESEYITYYSYRKENTVFADDEPIMERCSCCVEIYSKTDNQTLVGEVRKRLTSAEWYVSGEDEDYDEDGGLYVTRLDIIYEGVISAEGASTDGI